MVIRSGWVRPSTSQLRNPGKADFILEQPPQHAAWLDFGSGASVVTINRYPTFKRSSGESGKSGIIDSLTLTGPPDGSMLAFKRVTDFWADDIYLMPVAGGTPRRVTSGTGGIWAHAWTADGKHLVVSCQRGGTVFGLWLFPTAIMAPPFRLIQGGVDSITPASAEQTSRISCKQDRGPQHLPRRRFTGFSARKIHHVRSPRSGRPLFSQWRHCFR